MTSAAYMKTYRERRLAEARVFLGGRCVVCGRTEDLQFDHIDPETKIKVIANIWQNREKFWAEVAKCQLLCGPHHQEKTARDRGTDRITQHGTMACYRHSRCRCDPCKAAKSAVQADWYRRSRSGRDSNS